MLSDGDESRLMVSSGVDAGDAVEPFIETACDIGGEDPSLCSPVQALEKVESCGIGRRSLVERGKLLNDDVRVALDVARAVDLLGCREVVLVGVHEEASVEMRDRHRDRECLVLANVLAVHRVRELGGRRRLPCCVSGDRSGVYLFPALVFILLNSSPVDFSLSGYRGPRR